jgi:hypothetical protein
MQLKEEAENIASSQDCVFVCEPVGALSAVG